MRKRDVPQLTHIVTVGSITIKQAKPIDICVTNLI